MARPSTTRPRIAPFPRLSGEHGVGMCDVLPSFNEEEPTMIRLFYPTDRKAGDAETSELYSASFAFSYPYFKATMIHLVRLPYYVAAVLAYIKSWLRPNPKIPAIHQAPLLPGREQFPVVVFSHGHIGHRGLYSALQCDIASQGYIVAAVEHKDGSACVSYTKTKSETAQEGQPKYEDKWIEFIPDDIHALPLRHDQAKQRGLEMSLALNFVKALGEGGAFVDRLGQNFDFSQFKDRVDMDNAVAMGHSFGGASTVVAMANDDRFRCGVALDAWMFPVLEEAYDNIKKPLVFINTGGPFQWKRNVKCMMRLVEQSQNRGQSDCKVFTIRDSTHLTHCDVPFYTPPSLMRMGGYCVEGADIYEVFDASLQLTHAFLRRHLWNDPSPQPILDGGEGQHELVLSGTNLDVSGPDEGWMDPLTRH